MSMYRTHYGRMGMFTAVIKDWIAWLIILLAFAGLVYAGPMQDVGPGNPRPKEYLEIEQYKKDLFWMSSKLDQKFKQIEERLKKCEAK